MKITDEEAEGIAEGIIDDDGEEQRVNLRSRFERAGTGRSILNSR